MTREEFKTWMRKHDVNEVDVASFLKINPITVKRFLSGKRILPTILLQIEALVKAGPPKRVRAS